MNLQTFFFSREWRLLILMQMKLFSSTHHLGVEANDLSVSLWQSTIGTTPDARYKDQSTSPLYSWQS